jgi:hypothetical protein
MLNFMRVWKLLCINRTHLANLRAENKYLAMKTFEYLVRQNRNGLKTAAAHKSPYLDVFSVMATAQQNRRAFLYC